MIETFLLDLLKLTIGVCIGSYLGVKITKRELKGEISSYLTNELPHLLETKEVKFRIRELAHVFFQELISVITEEEKEDAKEDRKVHEKNRKRTSVRSKSRGLKRLPARKT